MTFEISEDDWDSHWSNYDSIATANPAQSWRFRSIVRIIKTLSNPADRPTITDLGCGQGDLLFFVNQYFPSSTLIGIEPSSVGSDLSRLKNPRASIIQADIIRNEAADDDLIKSDIVVCTEVLEHLDSPNLLLKSLSDKMGLNSSLVVSVPSGPVSEFDKHIGHRKHFTPESLRSLLEDSGFKVIDVYRSGFPGFNIYKVCTILMGKRLIKSTGSKDQNFMIRLVSNIFLLLMILSKKRSRLGWQLFAVCKTHS